MTSAVDVDRFFRNKDFQELTRKTYDNMGLEVRDILARSDLYERAGKNQHAFCLSVSREYPYDVRVLANVRRDSYWIDTMLHEFGHAVYDKHINSMLPYFLRTIAHTCTTEAIALMMGSLAEDPIWLSTVAGISEDELDEIREHLLWREQADRLVFTRWALVMFHFERELYADPERDEPDWAAKIHVAVAPVYYHNYVLGHLISAQLRHHLEDRQDIPDTIDKCSIELLVWHHGLVLTPTPARIRSRLPTESNIGTGNFSDNEPAQSLTSGSVRPEHYKLRACQRVDAHGEKAHSFLRVEEWGSI